MAKFTSAPGVTSIGIEGATFDCDEDGVFEITEDAVPKLLEAGVLLVPFVAPPQDPSTQEAPKTGGKGKKAPGGESSGATENPAT